jgi:predicted DsbA family dithiol-disulfide isomerase
MSELRIDVWSDIACPWCHVGKRRLEAALAAFPRRGDVEVVWRAFELDPAAARAPGPDVPYAVRLGRKYGVPAAQAEEMIRRMTATAAGDGLDLRFDRARPGNTFDAHRLLHLAHLRGRQDALKERLLTAYLRDGEFLGDHETLVRLAGEAGLDPDEARRTLAGDDFARDVRADEDEARRLGVRGVPFFVFGGRRAVSGAHPAETLLAALAAAWADLHGEDAPAGATCGPDGCA